MKTLLQITQEKMAELRKTVTVEHTETPTPDFVAEKARLANKLYEGIQKRLESDPALGYLAGVTATILLGLLSVAPDAMTRQATTKMIFSKMVEIWENANNEYSDQLKPKT